VSFGEFLLEISHLHLELILRLNFGLVGWYLHCYGHLVFVFAESVTLIIRKLFVSPQFASAFGRS